MINNNGHFRKLKLKDRMEQSISDMHLREKLTSLRNYVGSFVTEIDSRGVRIIAGMVSVLTIGTSVYILWPESKVEQIKNNVTVLEERRVVKGNKDTFKSAETKKDYAQIQPDTSGYVKKIGELETKLGESERKTQSIPELERRLDDYQLAVQKAYGPVFRGNSVKTFIAATEGYALLSLSTSQTSVPDSLYARREEFVAFDRAYPGLVSLVESKGIPLRNLKSLEVSSDENDIVYTAISRDNKKILGDDYVHPASFVRGGKK